MDEHPISRRRAARNAILHAPTFGGAVGALLFWWRSLYPTLMPRTWVAQAAMSALCIAIGYGLGTLVHAIVAWILDRRNLRIAPETTRRAWVVLATLAGLALIAGLIVWPRWQNEQRALVQLGDLSAAAALPIIPVSMLLTAVLMVIGRLIGGLIRRADRFNRRHLPGALGGTATVLLVLLVGSFLLRDVAFTQFTSWANDAFGTVDDGTADGTKQPTEPQVSGSPASLVRWDTLGYQGREFVAHATTPAQLRAFNGADSQPLRPIRVYTGLKSADTFEQQAHLAVRELQRTDAFHRKVLVVATATGTGWIDPDATRAIEQMYGGDTAVVSMQYSFLPSWISSVTDLDKAAKAGAMLYETVHRQWEQEPAATRPKLLVFGLSLGSYGAESAFAGVDAQTSLANITNRSDGALLVGATNGNPIHRQLTAAREAGSPVWRPVVDHGRVVRFVNRGPQPTGATEPWPSPRVLYVQHPSDPVTFWSFDSFYRPSAWMAHPRGFDVPTRGGWFPVVTGVQGVFDLMAGFGAPPGHGHDYRLDYVGAWAKVASPAGWTAAKTTQLEHFLFPS